MEICLEDIESWKEISIDYTYDIEVEDNHNFFLSIGNGILVHNSSKTYSTLQVIYNYLTGASQTKVTLSSYALPHLKQGVISDFDHIISSFGENLGYVKSAPAQPVYRIGESEVNCYGVEGNIAMAHGPRRNILYINECNRRITYDVFDQLFSRSQIVFLDFNPDREFWLHEKVMPNFPHVLIKSNYLDNPYLSENERANILMKKGKAGFENWWKVYGEGELGRLEGAILHNWEHGEFDDSLPYGYGLDFGSKHPDAMVKCAVDRNAMKLYWKEEVYQNNLSTKELAEIILSRGVGRKLIVADSAAKRTIQDLRTYGLNVEPVVKGKIVDDVKLLMDYKIIVDPNSPNLERNLNNWIWLDKKGEIPIDTDDDLIDAGRYYTRRMIIPLPAFKGNKILGHGTR